MPSVRLFDSVISTCEPCSSNWKTSAGQFPEGRRLTRQSILAGGDFAAEFVEEIEYEANLFTLEDFSGAAGLEYGQALAIGMQVKLRHESVAVKLTGRPNLGPVGMEGIARSRILCDHNSVVPCAIQEFLAVPRPPREVATARGNLPFATGAGKRPHVHFEVTRFVRSVSEPPAVRGERWAPFRERSVQEGLGFSNLPARLFIAPDCKGHDIPGGVRVELVEGQDLAIGTPGEWVLHSLIFS